MIKIYAVTRLLELSKLAEKYKILKTNSNNKYHYIPSSLHSMEEHGGLLSVHSESCLFSCYDSFVLFVKTTG